MRTISLKMKTLLVSLILILAFLSAAAQQRPALTVQWALGEAGNDAPKVPKAMWLQDGSALMYNERLPKEQRTFERFDLATRKSTPVIDPQRALASLKAAGVEEKSLDWPEEFDESGSKAVYLFKDDVYLLDLPTQAFTRVTSTKAEEKSPRFSPNGQLLAYVRDNDLYVFDVAKKTESRLTKDGSEKILNGTLTWVYWEEVFGRNDIGYWWSPDSKSIAFLQTDVTGVPVSTFVDFQPQNPRVIHQVYPKAGDPNPKVRVGVVGIGAPQARWIKIDDRPYEWLQRVKWLPDSSRLAVETLNRRQTELRLYFADAKTGAAKHILDETDPAFVNVSDDLHFLKDGQHFLWASERTGYMHIYRYTMDGKPVNAVTSGEWAIASSGTGVFWVRQAITGIDEKEGWLYFTAMKDGSLERHLYRVNLDGSGMTRLTKDAGTHRINMSNDTRFYFDTFSDINSLPALRLHASDGSEQAVVAAPRPELLPAAVHFPELLTVPAADGFPMPAQLLKPSNFDPAKKYPVILHIYGGPSAPLVRNGWQRDMFFYNVLAENGYVVVAMDNRAATAISKKLENTLVENPSVSETDDLVAGVKWLKQQSWADPERFGVYGWSGGGTNTLNCMTRSKEFKAGISGAPVTDWHYYDSRWAEALVKTPKENPALYESTSLVKRADQLHGRLLIIYGTYDDNVHPQNSLAFMDALIKAGIPYQSLIYPMRKHGFTDTPAKIHVGQAQLDFWKLAL